MLKEQPKSRSFNRFIPSSLPWEECFPTDFSEVISLYRFLRYFLCRNRKSRAADDDRTESLGSCQLYLDFPARRYCRVGVDFDVLRII